MEKILHILKRGFALYWERKVMFEDVCSHLIFARKRNQYNNRAKDKAINAWLNNNDNRESYATMITI